MILVLNENVVLSWEGHIMARCGDILHLDGLLLTNLITGIQKRFMTEQAVEDIKSKCKEISSFAYLKRIDHIREAQRKIRKEFEESKKNTDGVENKG